MASNVLVYGGAGALGRELVLHFKSKGWQIFSVDIRTNEEANHNILLELSDSLETQAEKANNSVKDKLKGNELDAVLCVAGGWAGGNITSKDIYKNSELMWKQSVHSSLIASNLAAHYLKEGGLLTLTGAFAAQEGTPDMIGYGMAKAAVHQLVRSLAQPRSGLPLNAKVTAILPVTLDTEINRKSMPNADFTCWTPLDTIVNRLYDWAANTEPLENGKLIQVETVGGNTRFTPV